MATTFQNKGKGKNSISQLFSSKLNKKIERNHITNRGKSRLRHL